MSWLGWNIRSFGNIDSDFKVFVKQVIQVIKVNCIEHCLLVCIKNLQVSSKHQVTDLISLLINDWTVFFIEVAEIEDWNQENVATSNKMPTVSKIPSESFLIIFFVSISDLEVFVFTFIIEFLDVKVNLIIEDIPWNASAFFPVKFVRVDTDNDFGGLLSIIIDLC